MVSNQQRLVAQGQIRCVSILLSAAVCASNPVMKIAIIGATGLLGSAIYDKSLESNHATYAPSSCDVQILDPSTFHLLENFSPDVLINCAAFTNVDASEGEKEKTLQLNADGPIHLAKWSQKNRVHMIHFSTDYVFDGSGETPWKENDKPNPINFYGHSKHLGDLGVQDHTDHFTIFRIQWVYGNKGKNFVDTMIRLSKTNPVLNVVDDQVGSLSHTAALANAVLNFLPKKQTGIFNLASQGYASWFEICVELKRLGKITSEIVPVKSDAFPRPATRPLNSRLDLSKICMLFGHAPMPHWKESLQTYTFKSE